MNQESGEGQQSSGSGLPDFSASSSTRSSQSLPDLASREGPVTLGEPSERTLRRNRTTMLAVIGGGAQLSAAGYLPTPLVAQLCSVFDIDPILAGKANRESNVRPLVAFRKVSQQLGLLHTSGGILMPTVKGIRHGADSAGLWGVITAHLPLGRSAVNV